MFESVTGENTRTVFILLLFLSHFDPLTILLLFEKITGAKIVIIRKSISLRENENIYLCDLWAYVEQQQLNGGSGQWGKAGKRFITI